MWILNGKGGTINLMLPKFNLLSDYENVLVTDEVGKVLFYDLADTKVLKKIGVRPENFIGHKVTSFYANLTNENSTVMKVLKTGEPVLNALQKVKTLNGNEVSMYSSTYPLKEDNKIVGAVEFSKHYFDVDQIYFVDQRARHQIYRKNNTTYTIDDIITQNLLMETIKSKINRIGSSNSSVLVYGKTGTGKELIAQAIHNAGPRYEKPFVSINCGAVPAGLIESTLFGTVKGSFTGAEDKPGIFEQAKGGTVFLDEINSLTIDLQVKLLKVIEEKTIRRVGGEKSIQLDFRIITATNEYPFELIDSGRMREDLYYRLSILQIDLPELKERQEDIELLMKHFIDNYNETMQVQIKEIDPAVLEAFKKYEWPGNIRQLRNAIETAYHNVTTDKMTIEDIPQTIVYNRQKTMAASKVELDESLSLKEQMERMEIKIIECTLHKTNGNISAAAKKLKLSKQTLHYKIQKYGIHI